MLQPFLTQLTDEKYFCGYFQQGSATAHTAQHYTQTLKSLHGKRVTNRGLWPLRPPDITQHDFFFGVYEYLKE
jgi:hypothetical protein